MSSDSLVIPAGSLIFHEDDKSEAVFLVKKGKVLVVKEYQGRYYPLKIVTKQGFLAETAMKSKSKRVGTTAFTLEDSELIPISLEEFNSFLDTAPNWVNDLMENFCDRVAHAQDLIAEHKILDDSLCPGFSLDADKEAFIRRLIKEHKSS